ncbi:MAG: hypothetical protein JNM27_15535 [Leptospirales bacterium]|nr:hypothetical protein [Leptospirales bacterium]
MLELNFHPWLPCLERNVMSGQETEKDSWPPIEWDTFSDEELDLFRMRIMETASILEERKAFLQSRKQKTEDIGS